MVISHGCERSNNKSVSVPTESPELDLEQADRLASLPLACIDVVYPNKLGQTLSDSTQLLPPDMLHPAFYGCFDWHSSVHGHWSLVKLLKSFPELRDKEQIMESLRSHLTAGNIAAEVAYFNREENRSYERTYGWAWLLKLQEELRTWDDPLAKELASNLQPLADRVVEGYKTFLPKLVYPVRVGEHSNTAFGMSFAYDYAVVSGDEELMTMIRDKAVSFYENDQNCPISWEPGGFDFLSPCLQEADIMRRVLDARAFEKWLNRFLPQLSDPDFELTPARVSDRSDGKLVHLDGLNFSRAWCLNGIANTLAGFEHLESAANEHITYSLNGITDGNYEGTHWLGSFALLALKSTE